MKASRRKAGLIIALAMSPGCMGNTGDGTVSRFLGVEQQIGPSRQSQAEPAVVKPAEASEIIYALQMRPSVLRPGTPYATVAEAVIASDARVAEAAGNPFLLDMIKTNARKLMAYYRARYHYKGVIAESAAEHREITTLILDRDAAGAEAAMTRHVQFDHVTAMDLLAALG